MSFDQTPHRYLDICHRLGVNPKMHSDCTADKCIIGWEPTKCPVFIFERGVEITEDPEMLYDKRYANCHVCGQRVKVVPSMDPEPWPLFDEHSLPDSATCTGSRMLVSVTRMATPDAPSPDSSEGSDEEKLKDSLGTETTEYGECPTCRNLVLVTEHDGEKVYITHDYEIGGSTLDEEKACVGSGGVLEGRTYDTPLGDWQRTEVPADVFDELLKRLEQPAKVIPGLLRLLNDQKVKGLFQSLKPRDPDRIDEVLAELERIWRAHPDLRLTQLIANVLPGTSPHYNVEDTDLLENLRRVYP